VSAFVVLEIQFCGCSQALLYKLKYGGPTNQPVLARARTCKRQMSQLDVFFDSPALEMLSDCLGWPVCVCSDYSYPRCVRPTNKGVRATFIVYYHDLKIGSWQPVQRRSHVARPNAPPRSVFELDDMTLIVPCN
jgi:hypothetical protein